jgi:hypothetical protein
MNGIAVLVPSLLMVLGVAAIYTAVFMLWKPASARSGSMWRPWLLIAGGTAACAAAALL